MVIKWNTVELPYLRANGKEARVEVSFDPTTGYMDIGQLIRTRANTCGQPRTLSSFYTSIATQKFLGKAATCMGLPKKSLLRCIADNGQLVSYIKNTANGSVAMAAPIVALYCADWCYDGHLYIPTNRRGAYTDSVLLDAVCNFYKKWVGSKFTPGYRYPAMRALVESLKTLSNNFISDKVSTDLLRKLKPDMTINNTPSIMDVIHRITAKSAKENPTTAVATIKATPPKAEVAKTGTLTDAGRAALGDFISKLTASPPAVDFPTRLLPASSFLKTLGCSRKRINDAIRSNPTLFKDGVEYVRAKDDSLAGIMQPRVYLTAVGLAQALKFLPVAIDTKMLERIFVDYFGMPKLPEQVKTVVAETATKTETTTTTALTARTDLMPIIDVVKEAIDTLNDGVLRLARKLRRMTQTQRRIAEALESNNYIHDVFVTTICGSKAYDDFERSAHFEDNLDLDNDNIDLDNDNVDNDLMPTRQVPAAEPMLDDLCKDTPEPKAAPVSDAEIVAKDTLIVAPVPSM